VARLPLRVFLFLFSPTALHRRPAGIFCVADDTALIIAAAWLGRALHFFEQTTAHLNPSLIPGNVTLTRFCLHVLWATLLYIVLCATSVATLHAADAETRSRPTSSALCESIDRLELKPGLLQRAFTAAKADHECWTRQICRLVSGLSRPEYAQFVRLVRRESVDRNRAEAISRASEWRHFQSYTTPETLIRSYECLDQGGQEASPETQFDLYLIARHAPQRAPVNPYAWLERAVKSGDPAAMYEMTRQVLLSFGNPPPEVVPFSSLETFQQLLRGAATAGVVEAQLQLARFYLGDMRFMWREAPVDVPAAIAWYHRAAGQEHDHDAAVRAAIELGGLYYAGIHVPQDYKESYRWYIRLDVTQVNPCSPLSRVRANLIWMYQEGLGVPRDLEKANQLLKFHRPCV
jgi:hypothetical protein